MSTKSKKGLVRANYPCKWGKWGRCKWRWYVGMLECCSFFLGLIRKKLNISTHRPHFCDPIFDLIWPEALNAVFSKKAEINLKSLEAHKKQKNELLLPFEKQDLKNTGRYKNQPGKKEADRKSAEEYWNKVSKKIRKISFSKSQVFPVKN